MWLPTPRPPQPIRATRRRSDLEDAPEAYGPGRKPTVVEPPASPKPIGTREVCLEGNNAWASAVFDWREHRDAAKVHWSACAAIKSLVEDDVSTRAFRVQFDDVLVRPGLAQRSVGEPQELTSRKSSADIPMIRTANIIMNSRPGRTGCNGTAVQAVFYTERLDLAAQMRCDAVNASSVTVSNNGGWATGAGGLQRSS